MKKEDIEKAALKYKAKLVEDVINYNNINAEENNYEAGKAHALDDFIEDAFKDGAEFRINSVWHTNKKKPTSSKLIIRKNRKGEYDLGYVLAYDTVSWAYVKDLLPNMED